MKETFLTKEKGWRGDVVRYSCNGGLEYTCSEDEWEVKVLRQKLLDSGADEKLLDELLIAVSEVARENEALDNMGEEL